MGDNRVMMMKNRPPLLPVSMAKTTKTKTKLPSVFSVPPPPVVAQLVCGWALFTACTVAGSVVYSFVHQCDPTDPAASSASRWATCVKLTDAEAVAASALQAAQLWLCAPQATAAALALLLPPGPRRRALAFAAHAATTGGHFLFATLAGLLFVPAPGNYHLVFNTALLLVFGVVDVLAFLALLSGEEEAA